MDVEGSAGFPDAQSGLKRKHQTSVTVLTESVSNLTHGYLTFEDGTRIEGISFGAERSVSGEAVFNTGMVGYPGEWGVPSLSHFRKSPLFFAWLVVPRGRIRGQASSGGVCSLFPNPCPLPPNL